jgi:replicative DNA helicase
MNPGEVVKAWDKAHELARDVRAEQSVLGACLNQPAILGWLDLDPDVFWDARHGHIWLAMRSLADGGKPVDEVTVASELESRLRLKACGGLIYLAELALRCLTVENVAAYAAILRGHLVTRRLLNLASSLPSRVLDGNAGEELLGDVQVGLAEIEPHQADDGGAWSDAVRVELVATVGDAERRARGEQGVGRIPTGISVIDAKIGGLPIGVPSVLGARPKVGKSSLALCIARSAAVVGLPVHVVTLEDKRSVWVQRALAQDTHIPVDRIASRMLDRDEMRQLAIAAEALAKAPGPRVDHGHGMAIERIVRMVRARRRELGTRLVILDYLQLLPRSPRGQREQELENGMNALAELAGRDDLAVLVLSQLSREGERDQRPPILSDFRGSGSIEQVGKLILALHPARVETEVELLVLANTQGPTARFVARWDAPRCWVGG